MDLCQNALDEGFLEALEAYGRVWGGAGHAGRRGGVRVAITGNEVLQTAYGDALWISSMHEHGV